MIPSPNFSTKRVIVVDIIYQEKKCSIKEKSKSNFNMYPIISKLINRSRTTYHTKPCYISYKLILVTHLGNTLIISYFSLRTTKWVKLSGKTAIFRWPYLRSHTINNPKFLRVLLPHYTPSICMNFGELSVIINHGRSYALRSVGGSPEFVSFGEFSRARN